MKTLWGGVIFGGVVLTPFAAEIHPSLAVLAAAAMFAAASMAAGGLLGLLFGVPRSLPAVAQVGPNEPETQTSLTNAAGPAPQSPVPGVAANTNLEEISDWLTKIIVGVSLTQLVAIKRGALHLFNAMAPSLGGSSTSAAFAGAEVVYFSVLGFFMGWFYARLKLGQLMSDADALANVSDRYLLLAERAQNVGDLITAQLAMDAAAATFGAAAAHGPASPSDLAARYNRLRATLDPSAGRTAQLEDVVRQARWLGVSNKFTMLDIKYLFQTGDEGSRVVALGIMQADTSCASLDSLLDAISNPKSAFEQYQALAAAEPLLPTLNDAEQTLLREALRSPQVVEQLGENTDRRALADRILAALDVA